MSRPLRIAAAQFPVSDDVGRNEGFIRRLARRAADAGADVVQFPETGLPGYAPSFLESLDGYDWDDLAERTERIAGLAASTGTWIVLGSMRPVPGGRPRICLHVISDRGEVVGVYDKRRLYRTEAPLFDPGRDPLVVGIGGHRCGFLVCYENCFPELFEEYRDLGVGLLFHSFHNASTRGPSSLTDLMPANLAARAADHRMWISASNSSCRYSPLAACIVRPDGSSVRAPRHRTGFALDDFPLAELGWTYDNRDP